MARTLYKERDRFVETYWDRYGRDTYLVGDAARRDEDGYFWIVGRIDDVINVSGHRLSTMEVESALVSQPEVAEAAVIGVPDEDTGQAIFAFVIPEGDGRGGRRARDRAARARRREDRQARPPEADRHRRRPAEDPLGQDHAPAAARHRRRRGRSATSPPCATPTSSRTSKSASQPRRARAYFRFFLHFRFFAAVAHDRHIGRQHACLQRRGPRLPSCAPCFSTSPSRSLLTSSSA